MLRPVRTILATTREEVDTALATADQITVEGDDELLSYAVNKAAGDPENRVTIDYGQLSSWFRPTLGSGVQFTPPRGAMAALALVALVALLSIFVVFLAPASGWPLVAIVAIVAVTLIAWIAISSGSNVTIQWKVTEKVSGRVVITRVKERASRQRAAV